MSQLSLKKGVKAYEVPVSPGVMKMLKRDYGYVNHLRVSEFVKICYRSVYRSKYKDYLERRSEDRVLITVVCPSIHLGVLYMFCRHLEQEFWKRFFMHVEARVEAGCQPQEAINTFYDKYDLSLEDIEYVTAYKRWQRYTYKEKAKDLIPLW